MRFVFLAWLALSSAFVVFSAAVVGFGWWCATRPSEPREWVRQPAGVRVFELIDWQKKDGWV